VFVKAPRGIPCQSKPKSTNPTTTTTTPTTHNRTAERQMAAEQQEGEGLAVPGDRIGRTSTHQAGAGESIRLR
jgi:hypothetical protein